MEPRILLGMTISGRILGLIVVLGWASLQPAAVFGQESDSSACPKAGPGAGIQLSEIAAIEIPPALEIRGGTFSSSGDLFLWGSDQILLFSHETDWSFSGAKRFPRPIVAVRVHDTILAFATSRGFGVDGANSPTILDGNPFDSFVVHSAIASSDRWMVIASDPEGDRFLARFGPEMFQPGRGPEVTLSDRTKLGGESLFLAVMAGEPVVVQRKRPFEIRRVRRVDGAPIPLPIPLVVDSLLGTSALPRVLSLVKTGRQRVLAPNPGNPIPRRGQKMSGSRTSDSRELGGIR